MFNLITMLIVFFSTVILIMWRPKGMNETIPTTIGATIILLLNIVPFSDVVTIFNIISGAAITILSTIVMSIVLESIGFFRWVAFNIVNRARGSGKLLFFYTTGLCFLMTLFFNNDGSILITTPIIIRVVRILNFNNKQMIPYLVSGALIATAASAPIAVSNIANLIALNIVGLDLNRYVEMMFVPSMVGIITITFMLFVYFKKEIPLKIPIYEIKSKGNTLYPDHPLAEKTKINWLLFNTCIFVVIITRGSFFILAPYGIAMEWIAIVGALLIIMIRWLWIGIGPIDVVKKTPWHILLFAFSMYVLVYGLRNIGFNELLVGYLRDIILADHLYATLVSGGLLTILSNIFNNLPAVMIGTLTITEMGLDQSTLQLAYLANIIGSDIGALLTPVGTLATLIWMFILRQNGIRFGWGSYIKVTVLVIPIGLVISLLSLYVWNEFIL